MEGLRSTGLPRLVYKLLLFVYLISALPTVEFRLMGNIYILFSSLLGNAHTGPVQVQSRSIPGPFQVHSRSRPSLGAWAGLPVGGCCRLDPGELVCHPGEEDCLVSGVWFLVSGV